jgi:hypothetical protein
VCQHILLKTQTTPAQHLTLVFVVVVVDKNTQHQYNLRYKYSPMSHGDNGDDLSNMLDAVAQAYSDSPTTDSGSFVEEILPELDAGFPEPDTDFPEDDNYEAFEEPPPSDSTTTKALHC